MQIEKNLKTLSLSLIIFALPFVDFVKNNFDELDIIIGKSFYFLIIILGFILIIFSYAIIFIFKKIDFYNALLIIVLFFWFFFKHNLLNLQIKKFLEKFNIISIEYSSEISLIILVILSIWFSILIYKKNLFLRRFLYIFFILSFFTSIIQISFFEKKNKVDHEVKKNDINFPDKLKIKKQNIYFFILDGMQPIKEFEKYYELNLQNFLNNTESKEYKYFHNTYNLYDNTTHGLSAIFYLNDIFTNDKKLKEKNKILYPTLLRYNNKSDLINNLNSLGYSFKWIGNFFAYCPKFNIKYCLNKNENTLIDTYLYINFFRQSPIIQIIINFGYFFNFDFNRHFFFRLNDGMGRLVDYLKVNAINEIKPTFYFIHHMSPHWPYITNSDCSYKNFPGNKNFEGYKSAYLCNIKKIQETINFLDKYDPNSTIIFQSDHNWLMSKNKQEKKKIFNLIKLNKTCKIDENLNLNNVNVLRLVFSCMTGNDPNYITIY